MRNVAEFFGDEPFLVMSGDALTDIDLAALRAAHEANDGIATLAVKRVADMSEFGVVITGSDGRDPGLPGEARPAPRRSPTSRSCMIYVFERRDLRLLPATERGASTSRWTCSRRCWSSDVPFYVHEIDAYWNDVGSLPEYLQGNLDAVEGAVDVELAGELLEPEGGEEALERGDPGVGGRVLAAARVARSAPGCASTARSCIGEGCAIGAGARVKESVVLPGAQVPAGRARRRRRLRAQGELA